MKKIWMVLLLVLGVYGAELKLSKERYFEDDIALRYGGKECKNPQDKIEGCVELTFYKQDTEPPYGLSLSKFIAEISKTFGESYLSKQSSKSYTMDYVNAVVKTFKNNQISETRFVNKFIAESGDGPLVEFSTELHSFFKDGKRHGLTEFMRNIYSKDGGGVSLKNDIELYFYKGEEIHQWLARMNLKECKTKADMQGECQYKEGKQLTVYINGNEFAKTVNITSEEAKKVMDIIKESLGDHFQWDKII